MHHYARLSGLNLPKEQLEKKIDSLVSQLGLAEQENTIVGDLFIKGLSGGQKRRLSICLEALTDPCNFFLDEPTSGLGGQHELHLQLQNFNSHVVFVLVCIQTRNRLCKSWNFSSRMLEVLGAAVSF